MTRKFKRGYIDREGNKYTIVVSKVIQNNDFGEYESEEEAKETLLTEFKVKELILL